MIYFAGNDPNGTYVLQALLQHSQLKTVTFAGTGGIMDSSFLQTAAQLHLSTPIYATLSIQDPQHSGETVGIDFERNYRANGYSNYQPYAASAYDCTMMLIQAIKTALQKKSVSTPHGAQDQVGSKQFRQAVLQELAHLTYTGATGTQSFDANGDTTNHTFSLYQLDLSNSQQTGPGSSISMLERVSDCRTGRLALGLAPSRCTFMRQKSIEYLIGETRTNKTDK